MTVVVTTSISRIESPESLHRTLAAFNKERLRPGFPAAWSRRLARELRQRVLEGELLEEERQSAAARAAFAPTDPGGFVAWFEALKDDGPGQHHPLFDWLATEATLPELRWFLTQEVAGEAGFEDLVALTQVKMPTRPKMEMAKNYWDEMGQGQPGGMHGPMLEHLARELGLRPTHDKIVWESLALGNIMIALASDRLYTFHAVGALGAIELTAPSRAEKVNAALKRLGVPAHARRYYALHATLDVKHSASWNREVLAPLVEADPRAAQAIAEGALIRLQAGARCYERYRRELGTARRVNLH
jgi:hypothetical protein